MSTTETIESVTLQHDNSGEGHNWHTIDASDLPANIAEEIDTEIRESQAECDDYTASNGLHYRWF